MICSFKICEPFAGFGDPNGKIGLSNIYIRDKRQTQTIFNNNFGLFPYK